MLLFQLYGQFDLNYQHMRLCVIHCLFFFRNNKIFNNFWVINCLLQSLWIVDIFWKFLFIKFPKLVNGMFLDFILSPVLLIIFLRFYVIGSRYLSSKILSLTLIWEKFFLNLLFRKHFKPFFPKEKLSKKTSFKRYK